MKDCDIQVISGDDVMTWPLMSIGAVGVISVVSNLCPSLVKSLVVAAQQGRMDEAMGLHRRLYDLAENLGQFGPNPLPIKTALAIAGLIMEEYRLPLCPLDDAARAEIENVLRRHELLTSASL